MSEEQTGSGDLERIGREYRSRLLLLRAKDRLGRFFEVKESRFPGQRMEDVVDEMEDLLPRGHGPMPDPEPSDDEIEQAYDWKALEEGVLKPWTALREELAKTVDELAGVAIAHATLDDRPVVELAMRLRADPGHAPDDGTLRLASEVEVMLGQLERRAQSPTCPATSATDQPPSPEKPEAVVRVTFREAVDGVPSLDLPRTPRSTLYTWTGKEETARLLGVDHRAKPAAQRLKVSGLKELHRVKSTRQPPRRLE